MAFAGYKQKLSCSHCGTEPQMSWKRLRTLRADVVEETPPLGKVEIRKPLVTCALTNLQGAIPAGRAGLQRIDSGLSLVQGKQNRATCGQVQVPA